MRHLTPLIFTLIMGCGAPPVSIAYVAPFDAAGRADSETVVRVLERRVKQLNEAGGSNGRSIRLEVFDDEGSPERAFEIAKKIAQRDFIGVIGHRSYQCSKRALEAYGADGIPVVNPVSAHRELTKLSKWSFRTTLDDELALIYVLGYVKELFRANTFTLIQSDDAHAATLAEQLISTATSAGSSVESHRVVPQTATKDDYDLIARQVAAEDSSSPILFIVGQDDGFELIYRLRALGIERPLMVGPAFFTSSFLGRFESLPDARIRPGYYTDGLYILTPVLTDIGSQELTEMAEWYRREYGRGGANLESALAVDALELFVAAEGATRPEGASESLSDRRSAVRDWIADRRQATAIQTMTGPLYFDGQGNRIRSAFLARVSGHRAVSASTQLRVLPHVRTERDLPMGYDSERVVQIGSHTLYRTDIVYSGVQLHSITELDEARRQFTLELELWLRHRAGLPSPELEIENAVEPVELGEPVDYLLRDGMEYRRYRARARLHADFIPAPYGRHVLGLSFRYAKLTSDSVLLALDMAGLGLDGRGASRAERAREFQRTLPSDSGWLVYDAFFFQDRRLASTLGRPEHEGLPAGDLSFSRLNVGLRVQRSDLSPRTLTPKLFAVPAFWASALLSLMLLFAARKTRRLRASLWMLQAGAAAVLLLAGEQMFGDILAAVAPVAYQQSLAKLFGVLWWLVPAVFIDVAIHRFLWAPLQSESEHPVPSILRRMVTLTIYLLAIFGIVAFVFDQKLTSLLATSGVIAMIVGLAIQINISNIFSGIALNVERPFRIGDWIHVHGRGPEPKDGIIGQVIDINWRTTRLRTTGNTVVVIPNAVISEKTVTNFMLPDASSRFEQLFYLDYAIPHERALELISNGLVKSAGEPNGPLADPKAKVRVNGATELGVEYLVRYWLLPGDVSPAKARDTVTRCVLDTLREAGIELAYPKRNVLDARS